MGSAVDLDKNLVEVPFVAGAGSAQLVGIVRPELGTLGADRLVGDHDTKGQHQLLDVTQGQRKTMMQSHRVPDDLDRIPIAFVSCRDRHNDQSWQHHTNVDNLTMPARYQAHPTRRKAFRADETAVDIECDRCKDSNIDYVPW
jgi:hypothetical protein